MKKVLEGWVATEKGIPFFESDSQYYTGMPFARIFRERYEAEITSPTHKVAKVRIEVEEEIGAGYAETPDDSIKVSNIYWSAPNAEGDEEALGLVQYMQLQGHFHAVGYLVKEGDGYKKVNESDFIAHMRVKQEEAKARHDAIQMSMEDPE